MADGYELTVDLKVDGYELPTADCRLPAGVFTQRTAAPS
jgi:hypothetical protein